MLHIDEAKDLRAALSEHFPEMKMEVKPRRMVAKGEVSSYYFMTNQHGYRMTITNLLQNQKDLVEGMDSVDTFYRNTGNICVKTDNLDVLVRVINKCETI